jgi:hypothetical protein
MARFVAYESSKAFVSPTKETINGIEEAIRWAEVETPARLRFYMNELCFYMALVNQRFARKLSFGPEDPGQKDPALAWRLPVRRISGRYYMGWKVKQRGYANWILYNDTREAYYIEFGINWRGAGRRVRRPVRKLSLRQTLEFMMTTQAYHRVWAEIFSSPRHRSRGQGFTQVVQSRGMGGFSGPMLGRRLP